MLEKGNVVNENYVKKQLNIFVMEVPLVGGQVSN